MSINTYISSGDITALVAADFNLTTYLSRVNDAVDILAYSMGIDPSGITGTTHLYVKEYAREYLYANLYLDKIGANNTNSPEQDKYMVLYTIHNKNLEQLRNNITPEILSGNANSPTDFASTVMIYRN